MNVEENVKKENESASEQKEAVNKEVKKELKETVELEMKLLPLLKYWN